MKPTQDKTHKISKVLKKSQVNKFQKKICESSKDESTTVTHNKKHISPK